MYNDERWASGAAGSGSAADAVRRRLHAVVSLHHCSTECEGKLYYSAGLAPTQ
jgi:hypothetical protein